VNLQISVFSFRTELQKLQTDTQLRLGITENVKTIAITTDAKLGYLFALKSY
jgi:hypothetical protein